jgi:uncharacterized DUF497 family protein
MLIFQRILDALSCKLTQFQSKLVLITPDIVYFAGGEERCNTIGAFGPEIVAIVTHTDRTIENEEITRIISFRKANSAESTGKGWQTRLSNQIAEWALSAKR